MTDRHWGHEAGLGLRTVYVGTLNLHGFQDSWKVRAKGIAREMVSLGLDAMGVQELCRGQSGSGDDFATELIAQLKSQGGGDWEIRRASTHLAWDTYDEGIAILAPASTVTAWGEQALPKGNGLFPRKVVWARLTTPRGSLLFYVTHLDVGDWQARQAQAQELMKLVASHDGQGLPRIVVGDYNDLSWTAPIQVMQAGPPAMIDAWAHKNPGQAGFTFSAAKPERRIDYIFVESAALGELRRVDLAFHKPFEGVQLSDHFGLFGELRIR